MLDQVMMTGYYQFRLRCRYLLTMKQIQNRYIEFEIINIGFTRIASSYKIKTLPCISFLSYFNYLIIEFLSKSSFVSEYSLYLGDELTPNDSSPLSSSESDKIGLFVKFLVSKYMNR